MLVVHPFLRCADRIANTERHLDLAKAHNERAVDETKELEALNRSIFRPTMSVLSHTLLSVSPS